MWKFRPKEKMISMNLGREDRISGWLACATNGAFKAGVRFNAFSSCAGGSCKPDILSISWETEILCCSCATTFFHQVRMDVDFKMLSQNKVTKVHSNKAEQNK